MTSQGRAELLHRVVLAAIVLLALLTRLVHLRQPIRYDEAWMLVNYASRPLHVVLSDYSLPNNHIFHTLLVWTSTRLLGNAPWVVRLPTLIAGVVLVPAIYVATRDIAGREAGLFAAALAASLPSLVLYSTNARGYMIICLAFVALIALANAIRLADEPRHWIAFASIMALGIYTAPVMIYPAGVAVLWLLIERARQHGTVGLAHFSAKLFAALVAAGTLALLAYSPVIATSGVAPLISNRFVTALSWTQFAARLPDFLTDLRTTLGLGISFLFAAGLILAAIVSASVPRFGRDRRIALAAAAVVWCVVVLAATRRPPPARVWLFVVPLGCILAATGLAALTNLAQRRLFPAACALLLCAGMAAHTYLSRVVYGSTETDIFGLRGAEQIAQFSLAQLRPGDQLVAIGLTTAPLEYYFLAQQGRRLADYAAPSRTGRLLVIVNGRQRQTLDLVKLRRRDLPWNDYGLPSLLKRYAEASVYEFRRGPSAAASVASAIVAAGPRK